MRYLMAVPVGLEEVALEEVREALPDAVLPAGEEEQIRAPWPSNWAVNKSDRKRKRRLRRGLETEVGEGEGGAGAELPVDLDAELLAVKPTVLPGYVAFDVSPQWGIAPRSVSLKTAKAVLVDLAAGQLPETDDAPGVEAMFKTGLLSPLTSDALEAAVAEWRAWSGRDIPSSDLTFRVTVEKTVDYAVNDANRKYAFSSVAAAAWLGWGVGARTGWKVDLKNFHLHFVCQLYRRRLRLGLALTDPTSSNSRNRAAYGATSLQVQVAACMARLAAPAPGDVLLDLFAGTGIIPIEAIQYRQPIISLASDVEGDEATKAAKNVAFTATNVGVFNADASKLPLRDASVSKIVTDMPWGRRCGGYIGNTALYPRFLREARRIIAPDGDMWLLTLEKGIMRRALQGDDCLWTLVRAYHVLNGFDVVLLHLQPR